MVPVNAPLPTAWNFPFQAIVGSHTSILMSESLDGLSVAATRQNAGRSLAGWAAPPRPAGGVKPPAGTASARVMVASGSLIDPRLSHDPAAASGTGAATSALNASDAAETRAKTANTRFIVRSLGEQPAG